ncbi:vascular-related unknown protein 1-like isoform X2 [Silene latifolia]
MNNCQGVLKIDQIFQDSLSTTNNYSVSKCESSSENSGWSLYIDDSEDSSSIACSSSCSEPQCSAVYNVVSARPPVAKRRKITADFIDHDLEDTASSPVCSSKVEELENLRTKFQGRDDDLSMALANQIGELDYDSCSKEKINTATQIGELMESNLDWKEMSYTKLREKGLCLVPVSMLFNFP